jgi:hypothetical protein
MFLERSGIKDQCKMTEQAVASLALMMALGYLLSDYLLLALRDPIRSPIVITRKRKSSRANSGLLIALGLYAGQWSL